MINYCLSRCSSLFLSLALVLLINRTNGWTTITTQSSSSMMTGGEKTSSSPSSSLSRRMTQKRNQNSIILKASSSSSSSSTSSITTTGNNDDDNDGIIWTEEELLEYASMQGIEMSLTTLGPGYRAVVRASHNTSIILGYCEGFLRPGGTILHLDKMEVFQKMIQRAAATAVTTANKDEKKKDMYTIGSGTFFGVGLLLGYQCLLHGKANGCRIAEFLAIDDEEKQHRKLVKYYKRSGFNIIKYVGDDFTDIPDRLIWGGCGTLMRVDDINTLLKKWTSTLRKSKKKQLQQQQ